MLKKTPNPSLSSEEWTARLRAAVQKDRRRFRLALWSLAIAFFVLLGFGVYWFWPPPSLPDLTIVAIDSIGLPGEPVQVRAQIVPIKGDPFRVFLGGLKVAFQSEGASAQARTTGDGEARANLQFSPQVRDCRFLARLLGDDRRDTIEDSARIFFWPSKTKVVLADFEDLFDPSEMSKGDLFQRQADENLAKFLQKIHSRKYEIVYLAVEKEFVQHYRLARRWKESKKDILPPGPVLAKSHFFDFGSEDSARPEAAMNLQEHYEVKAIARNQRMVELYSHVRIPCVVFGTAAESWKELENSFP